MRVGTFRLGLRPLAAACCAGLISVAWVAGQGCAARGNADPLRATQGPVVIASGPDGGVSVEGTGAECEGQQPERAFCAGDVVRSCADLVSFADIVCGEGETCAPGLVGVRCACKAGYAGTAGACVDIDECKVNGGGCDEGAPCRNTEGSYTCGQCPAGYVGGGDDCTPSLTSLVVSPQGMRPEFDTVHTEYRLSIPLSATAIALKATSPAAATIRVAGTEVKQRRTWRSESLVPGPNEIEIVVSEGTKERKYTLLVTRGTGAAAYLKAPNADANDNFGASIAIWGDTMVIGAPGEDSNARGVFSAGEMRTSAADNSAQSAGAAYVFTREGETWSLRAYLKAGNPAAGALFGATVAIADNTIVVGAPGDAASASDPAATAYASGAAYVFGLRRDEWSQRAYLKASNAGAGDMFGSAIAISGGTIVVGAPGEASSVTGVNGAPDNNGALGSGAAYVFVLQHQLWVQHTYLKADRTRRGDSFGSSVAISGDTILIGATGEDGGATGINREPQEGAADNSGAAYTFIREDDAWYQDAYFKSSLNALGDSFGHSVAVAGDTAVVGAPGSSRGNGAAYVFVREGGIWAEQDALVNADRLGDSAASGPGDAFGASVSVVDESILIGAYGDDCDGISFNDKPANTNAPNSGAAYLLARNSGFWLQSDFIKPIDTRPNEQFGSRIAISSDTIAIGAMNDGRNPRELMQMETEVGPPNSGSVYIFR